MKNGKFLTLAFESSCDETAVAVVADGREVLSNVISSQIEIHKAFGGVVPEIASRHHLMNVNAVTEQAIEDAGVNWDEIDLIGVTKGPGLVGALLIGVATAKAFAFAKRKPLVGVHHIQGHIGANYIAHPELKPPFTALIVSGGHTSIAEVTYYTDCKIIGSTRDDAAGEAYDKVARVLGLGYPGGPKIDKIAKEGDPNAIKFKRVYLEKDSLDFSFSGIKTAVLNYVNSEKQAGREINVPDVAASFQQAILEVIVNKAIFATKKRGDEKLVLAGGVAANSRLRAMLSEACQSNNIRLYFPPIELCTDNAAMISSAAYYLYKQGKRDDLTLDAYPSLPL
ncbi:MAG: tRNA (adenosine(37)-N6)-threonylcarbamoyltransferase complex transferase subunit TsaD [Eubacteriales bacterium]|nr:tRNA (adenosine(37)-N6)-threonylcarbamoyltransferase complex transferase subunit TsaD [Eubacteriales bacterium]MDD4390876.1 tRNA (adenosine(37)-N6)-threonylcarbamoyltransferase complex transferase subunit TsaD [Eubacteriales bacterium]